MPGQRRYYRNDKQADSLKGRMDTMEKQTYSETALGITYQMTLDSFLDETHHASEGKKPDYEEALECLKEMKQFRGWQKKRQIANEALSICSDCIEAYMALGMYTEDVFETLAIYKKGLELATMNLGIDYFQQPITDFYEQKEAEAFFRMKVSYACALYELGFMRKAQLQYQEILSLNPSDVFAVRYYLFASYLYFEEFEKFRELMNRYPKEDTFSIYANFLYFYKRQLLSEAKALLPKMQKQNLYLYEILSYERMNIRTMRNEFEEGSNEEAAYCQAIFNKVTAALEYLPSFLVKER